MALLLAAVAACWLGICVLAIALCMAAKHGDAALMPSAMPRPRRQPRRGGFRGRVPHGA